MAAATCITGVASLQAAQQASESTPITFESNALLLSCPGVLDVPTVVAELSDSATGSTKEAPSSIPILLPPSASDRLCILHRTASTSTDNGTTGAYQAIGRTYGGYDWESVAGPEIRATYTCGVDPTVSSTQRYCQLVLDHSAPLSSFNGNQGLLPSSRIDAAYVYYLTSYESSLSDRDRIARFLERTTYGPTRSDLDNFQQRLDNTEGKSLPLAQAQWVQEQMNAEDVGISSHREYWRKRLNPRAIESYYMGEVGPEPCEVNSRWRKFAFTRDDVWLSTASTVDGGPGYSVEIEALSLSNQDAYLLRFGGHVRTVLRQPFELLSNGRALLMDRASYKLCLVDEIEGSAREYPDRLGLLINDVCELVVGGNPTIDLDGIIDRDDLNVLDFSGLASSSPLDLIVNNEAQTRGGDLLLRSSVNLPACDELPSVYDNDGRAEDEDSTTAYR